MKHLLSLKTMITLATAIFAINATSAVLWNADFESPDYNTGDLLGQHGWYDWDGNAKFDVYTSFGSISPPEGSQFVYSIGNPPSAAVPICGNSNFYANLSAINMTAEYVRVDYMAYCRENANIGFYVDAGSQFFIHHSGGRARLTWNGGQDLGPCPFDQWNEVSFLLDPSGATWELLWVEIDGNRVAAPATFNQPGVPERMRFRSYGTNGFGFDAVSISSEPAGPALTPGSAEVYIDPYNNGGVVRMINVGRTETFTCVPSSTYSWITFDASVIGGVTSDTEASLPFTVDKSTLPVGTTTGSVIIACGSLGDFTLPVYVVKEAFSPGIATIAGLHVTQVSPNGSGDKYYQDTMIYDTTPHTTFDGGMMDIAVIEGWYTLGNINFTNGRPYVAAHVLDAGDTAIQTVSKGTFNATSNNVLKLDSSVYTNLNPVSDNGSDPDSSDAAGYVSDAALQKEYLDCPLHLGVNRFTLLSPNASEIGGEGMVGLYVYASNEAPVFVEGQSPTLAAVDDGSGIIDADGFQSCGYIAGDATYFQKGTNWLWGTTLSKTYGDYRIEITYCDFAGDNDQAINPFGFTSVGAPGYLCNYGYGQWGIDNAWDDALIYLEITVSELPPVPYAPETDVSVGVWDETGQLSLQNAGASQFEYTATSHTAWITLDTNDITGTVEVEKLIDFTVDRSSLPIGDNYGTVSVDTVSPATTIVYTVHARVVEPGVLNIYGLHITQVSPNGSGDKYYQDTMIGSRTPAVAFNGAMDIAVLRNYYCFGNQTNDPLVAPYLMDVDTPCQYIDKGHFMNVVNVYRMSTNYPILNPVSDNGSNPEVSGDIASYISAANLTKEDLAMTLQEGTNRFTLISPAAVEIGDQGMIGLYVLGADETPDFTPGELPTVAAVDDNSGYIEAEGFESCGYVEGDGGYFQKATNMFPFGESSLSNIVDTYRITITHFNVDGVNDETVNQYGMSSPSTVGYVCDTYTNQWPIQPQYGNAISYLEVHVELIPEPSMFIGLIALTIVALRKAR